MSRYLPYWSLYLHQGMITALILQGVAGYFRYTGLDLAQLSWLSLSLLPWVAKFLWAPWGERHALPLRGVPYLGSLVILQLTMAVLLLTLGFMPPTQSVLLIVLALMLLALFSASHDIYADGLTLCTTNSDSRPAANAAQVGGSYLGMFAGSMVFLSVAQFSGWGAGFAVMALFSLLLVVVPLLTRYPVSLRPAQQAATLSLRDITALWPVLAFTAVYYLAMRGMMALQTVILIDQHLSLAALGQTLTLYSTVASGAGIVLGNLLAKRLGAIHCLLPVMMLHALLAVILACGYAQFSLTAWLVLFGAVNLAAAIGFVTLYNVLMGLVRPHQPASDYALFQSVDAAVALLASFGALRLAHHAGYPFTLMTIALLAVACLWPASRLRRRLSAQFDTRSLPADSSVARQN
ncbi:MFS transporter [Pseudomonas cerasi]